MLPVWLSTPPSSSPSCWAAWARSEWPSAHPLAWDLFHTADPTQGTKCLSLNSCWQVLFFIYAWLCSGWRASYYEHCDEDVLFGDLGVREDVLQHRTHVRFVPFSQVDNTLVIVSCWWEQEWSDVQQGKNHPLRQKKDLDWSLDFKCFWFRRYRAVQKQHARVQSTKVQTVQSMSDFSQCKKCTVQYIFLILMKDALLCIFCTEQKFNLDWKVEKNNKVLHRVRSKERSSRMRAQVKYKFHTNTKSHCPAYLQGWNFSISAHFLLFVHKIETIYIPDRSESFLQVFPAL